MDLRLPLAALRERLDTDHDSAHWWVRDGPPPERTLTVAAGAELAFPLRLDAPLRLRAAVRLPLREWLRGTSAVTAYAAVDEPGAGRRRVAEVRLAAASALGLPEDGAVLAVVPASATALVLGVEREPATDAHSVAHAEWIEPELVDARGGGPGPIAAGGRLAARGAGAERGDAGPRFSILTPVHDPPPAMLEATIASVLAQTHADWQLCLADDASADPEVAAILARHAAADPRITVVRDERAGGISAATNHALVRADGEYVIALDHDDTLPPQALATVAARLRADPALDMLYSDEAIVRDGRVAGVYRKPGWGLEGLQCLPYAHHLGAARTALVRELGGLRSQFDGCQDYDLELRIAERTDRVAHIPEVLYEWHAHAASTAGGEMAKPWAYLRQRDALAEHLRRTGIDADVQFGGRPGVHRIVHRVDPERPVTIACATDDAAAVADALRSWTGGPHRAWRAVIAAPAELHAAMTAALRDGALDEARVTLVGGPPGATGLAAALDDAFTAPLGPEEVLVAMAAPCLVLDRDCLRRLVGYATLPGVAAAGAVVHARDGRIAEAGVALPDGLALARLRGAASSRAGQLAVNVSAVDTVLATARATYERLGGLDPASGELALVDYALRGAERGLRAVVLGDVRVREPVRPQVNDLAAIRRLRSRWLAAGGCDPHHHPAFRTDRGDLALRVSGP